MSEVLEEVSKVLPLYSTKAYCESLSIDPISLAEEFSEIIDQLEFE